MTPFLFRPNPRVFELIAFVIPLVKVFFDVFFPKPSILQRGWFLVWADAFRAVGFADLVVPNLRLTAPPRVSCGFVKFICSGLSTCTPLIPGYIYEFSSSFVVVDRLPTLDGQGHGSTPHIQLKERKKGENNVQVGLNTLPLSTIGSCTSSLSLTGKASPPRIQSTVLFYYRADWGLILHLSFLLSILREGIYTRLSFQIDCLRIRV